MTKQKKRTTDTFIQHKRVITLVIICKIYSEIGLKSFSYHPQLMWFQRQTKRKFHQLLSDRKIMWLTGNINVTDRQTGRMFIERICVGWLKWSLLQRHTRRQHTTAAVPHLSCSSCLTSSFHSHSAHSGLPDSPKYYVCETSFSTWSDTVSLCLLLYLCTSHHHHHHRHCRWLSYCLCLITAYIHWATLSFVKTNVQNQNER